MNDAFTLTADDVVKWAWAYRGWWEDDSSQDQADTTYHAAVDATNRSDALRAYLRDLGDLTLALANENERAERYRAALEKIAIFVDDPDGGMRVLAREARTALAPSEGPAWVPASPVYTLPNRFEQEYLEGYGDGLADAEPEGSSVRVTRGKVVIPPGVRAEWERDFAPPEGPSDE